MFCTKCGYNNTENLQYCPQCGKEFPTAQATVEPTATVAPNAQSSSLKGFIRKTFLSPMFLVALGAYVLYFLFHSIQVFSGLSSVFSATGTIGESLGGLADTVESIVFVYMLILFIPKLLLVAGIVISFLAFKGIKISVSGISFIKAGAIYEIVLGILSAVYQLIQFFSSLGLASVVNELYGVSAPLFFFMILVASILNIIFYFKLLALLRVTKTTFATGVISGKIPGYIRAFFYMSSLFSLIMLIYATNSISFFAGIYSYNAIAIFTLIFMAVFAFAMARVLSGYTTKMNEQYSKAIVVSQITDTTI